MATINIGKQDVIWSYLGTFFRVSTNILLLPLLVYFLTQEELGLWYVFASVAQLVVLFDFGFAPTFARNISYIWSGASQVKKELIDTSCNKETDWVAFKTILKTCSSIYAIIATTGLIILLTIGSLYISKVSSCGYLLPWTVYCIAVFLNILYGYYTSFLGGIGAIAENHKAAIFSKIIQLLLTALLLLLDLGLLGVSIAYLLSGLSLRVISKYYFEKYEDIGSKIRDCHIPNMFGRCISNLKLIWHNAYRDGLVTISNFLTTQANTLICSYVISLNSTGSFGISLQIATLISSIAAIPFSSYQTKMQGNAAQGDEAGNLQLFSRALFMYVCGFVILGACSFLAFPLLKLIKPEFEIDIFIYIAILFQTLLYGYYSLHSSFISCYNFIPYTEAYILTAIISIVFSFMLAKYSELGIWALVIAPTIVSLYNVYKWPNYARSRILHIGRLSFMKYGLTNTLDIIKKKSNLKYERKSFYCNERGYYKLSSSINSD